MIGRERGVGPTGSPSVWCPALLTWGREWQECCSLRKASLSESPLVRSTVVVGGRWGDRAVLTVKAVILCVSFTPRTTLVDEETGSEGREHRRAEAPELVNSDVRFPLPWGGLASRVRVLSTKQRWKQVREQSDKGVLGFGCDEAEKFYPGHVPNRTPTEPTPQ